jgi:ketosteroid isomerase-like protein
MITSDDVRSNAERYFEALQRFDLDEVVRCFAEDAFYSHPSYDEDGGQREEARGRDGIAAMLRRITSVAPPSGRSNGRDCRPGEELQARDSVSPNSRPKRSEATRLMIVLFHDRLRDCHAFRAQRKVP